MEWSIGKIMSKRAMVSPNKPALIFEDNPVTYKQLNDESNRIAHLFQSLGLKKGDRISVDLLNCPEFLAIYMAAAKLGLIFAPLNFRMVAPEIEYQLKNSGARLIVFHDMFAKNIEPIRSSTQVEEDKFIVVRSGASERGDCGAWARDYHELLREQPCDEPVVAEPVKLSDPLAIIYTSGVTGAPKGAVLSHEQTYYKNFQIMLYTDMREEDIFLSQLPLFHSGGLFIIATPVLCRGATLVMRGNFRPDQFAADIERYRVTVIFALTTMWRFVLQAKALDGIDTSSVRVVLGGGERTPASLIKELAEKGLYMQTGFGQTENSAMMMLPKADIMRKAGSIGLPGFFTEIWIEDSNGRRLPPGEIGEIVATGPTVMTGYWNNPEKTRETIVNGVLHTGDLGYTDKDGYFYIVDRAKDMYRSGGENVYPAEIEKVLCEHPKIENVSIIGVPDDRWGETGKAFVVCKKGDTITKDEIYSYLDGKVARYKFPTHIVLVDSLPMTSSGKIRKSALKEAEATVFD